MTYVSDTGSIGSVEGEPQPLHRSDVVALPPSREARIEMARARIENSLEPYFQQLVDYDICSDTLDERVAALEREVNFYTRVYRGVMDAVLGVSSAHDMTAADVGTEVDPVVEMRFDVDFTVRDVMVGLERELRLPRPAFEIVVNDLAEDVAYYGKQLRVGLLTTISQDELVKELGDPTYLRGVINHVDASVLTSSREALDDPELRLIDEMLRGTDAAAACAIFESILDPLVVPRILDGTFPFHEYLDVKLAILMQRAGAYPGRIIVCVDDCTPIAMIDPKHPQLRGVCVGQEVHNPFMRQGAEALISPLNAHRKAAS